MRLSIAIMILMLGLSSAAAETYVSDGFGLVPQADLGEARSHWAGLRAKESSTEFLPTLQEPDAIDSVMAFIGPKSMVAGIDRGHAVALSLDRHGNLATDGQPGVFRLGPEVATAAATRYGIGDLVFSPTTLAGTYSAGAEFGGRQSPRALFRVTADLESVPLILAPAPRTEPEEVLTLLTGPLRDQYGNPVEDGTALAIQLDHGRVFATDPGVQAQEVSVVTARSVGGVGQAEILTRDLPPKAEAHAVLGANRSPLQSFEIAQVRLEPDPDLRLWARDDVSELRLRLGPLLTNAGHLIYEGAEIDLRITPPRGEAVALKGWTQDGYVWLDVPLGVQEGDYEIAISSAFGTNVQRLPLGPAPRDTREELVQ